MRAVILSDSHGNTDMCDNAISAAGKVDFIIHLGDIARDCDYIESVYAPVPCISVAGNNDFFCGDARERVFDFDGHKLFLCHGHTRGVQREKGALIRAAKERGCEAALFGHTHIPFLEREDGILLLNPGSCAYPRGGGKKSFAVLETEEKKLSAVIVDWVL